MAPTCRVDRGRDGVAVVTMSNPPVNALHPALLKSLAEQMTALHADPQVRAIVVTGDGKNFCAGFDIAQFASQSPEEVKAAVSGASQTLTAVLETGAKPTVAAIRGVALGGGCEIAVACNARVCTPTAKIGLPELQLGIIPGFGGTQRLPRLVGLQAGLELILTSKPIKGSRAKEAGLVDETVGSDAELIPAARRLALDIASGRTPRVQTLQRKDRLESPELAQMIFGVARDQTRRRAPHVRRPLLCIDAIEAGVLKGGEAGLQVSTLPPPLPPHPIPSFASADTHHAPFYFYSFLLFPLPLSSSLPFPLPCIPFLLQCRRRQRPSTPPPRSPRTRR